MKYIFQKGITWCHKEQKYDMFFPVLQIYLAILTKPQALLVLLATFLGLLNTANIVICFLSQNILLAYFGNDL